MTDWMDSARRWWNARAYTIRTVAPGLVSQVTSETGREREADFNPGVGDLVAGQAVAQDITPGAPVLTLAGGGFFVGLPSLPGDEVLGLASDRPMGPWRQTRTPGQADQMTGKGGKSLSDVCLAPFAITAPPGAPDSWDGLVLGGPAGVAIELDSVGAVTITKQGAPVSTIEMDAAGSVTITVETGQSVNLGGPAALALAKAQALTDAVDAMLTAMVSAAAPIVPPNGDGGTAGFVAGQGAWNGLKSAIATLKAKGE